MPKTKAPEMKRGVEVRKSKYVGVSWRISKAKYGASGKWTVQIARDGVHKHLGAFPLDKEKQAAELYDVEARKLHGSKAKLNFPRAGESKYAAAKKRTAEQVAADKALRGRKSSYVGVSWSVASAKWHVSLTHENEQRSLGFFPADQEKQAAELYDEEARKLRGSKAKLNFPRAGELKGAARTMRTKEQVAADKALGATRKSKYVGVSWSGAEGKWHVAISHNGVGRNVGSFPADQEEEAAKRYDEEARRLRGAEAKLNFPRAGEAQAGVGKKSKYVGVSWSACDSKWLVHTSHKGVKRAVGRFPPDQEKEAAECYDKEARKEKNRPVNFPRAGEEQAIKRGSVLPQNEREAADS